MKKQKNSWKQYGKWIGMTVKRQLKRPSFYVLILGVLFLLYLTQNVILPKTENTCVGIFAEDSWYGERIKEELLKKENGLVFVETSGAEELEQAVYRGEYDCGFVLPGALDNAVRDRDLDESIIYVYSTATTKGFVAKESVYAVLFQYLSEEILKQESESGFLFEEKSSEAAEAVLANNEKYLNSDEIFTVEFVEKDNTTGEREASAVKTVPGILGSCMFAAALLYGRYKFCQEYENVGKKLRQKERFSLRFSQIFIPLFMTAILLEIFTDLAGGENLLRGIFAMLFLVALSTGWTLLFAALFRNEQKYLCSICGVLVLSLLICPVFSDLAVYFPAVGVLRKVFPVYYYLWLLG